MPGHGRPPRGPPVGLDRAHHLEPRRRLRRRLQQRHLAQPGRPAHLRTTPSRASRSRSGRPTRWRPPGPTGTLEVPADAVTWDAATDTWVPVAAGHARRQQGHLRLLASTSVSNWHDGQPITHRRCRLLHRAGLRPRLRPGQGARSRRPWRPRRGPYLETFKGFRITDDDQLEVYVDYWHFDEDHIAAYASPTSLRRCPGRSSPPWTTWCSSSAARPTATRPRARYNVPWLSLVLTRDAGLVDRTLRAVRSAGRSCPPGVFQVGDRTLVTPEEADGALPGGPGLVRRARRTWSSATGPFFLEHVRPAGAVRGAGRVPRPDATRSQPGDFDLGAATELSIDAPSSADPSGSARTPSSRSPSQGPGTLALRYLLSTRRTGTVVVERRRRTPARRPAASR